MTPIGRRWCSSPTGAVSSPPATYAVARSNGSPPRWERAPWRFAWCMSGSSSCEREDRLAYRLAHRQLENGEIGLYRSQEGAGVDRETADSGEAFLTERGG